MENQKELIEKILKNDVNGVKEIISLNEKICEICDEHGMTPLQHAAYKGNKEIVQLLLDQGADVNVRKHEYGYTALHFAALSGNTDVCQLLLENGAKTYETNSVGRTPSQMAAFVGNHACVTVINNFVPKSEIDYYTVINGLETEPKLPPIASAPLHKFLMHINLNPVRVAINLIKSPVLHENLKKVKNVLELMSHKEMRKGIETNEIMSFKFHYLACIVAEIIQCKNSLEQKEEKERKEKEEGKGEKEEKDEKGIEKEKKKKEISAIELFIRKMLKINKGSVPEYQESFLRDTVRKFPNAECTIYNQMVSSLFRAEPPMALSVITSTINGQRGFIDSDVSSCGTCGEEKADKKCSQCKSVQYCDRDCQKYHWFVHKRVCAKVNEQSCQPMNDKSKQEGAGIAAEQLLAEIQNLKT